MLSARGLARLQEREPLRRFERPHPNQLWQMDLKEEAIFPFGRAHLLAVNDDASRFCLGGEWIPRKSEAATLGALANVFARWGFPQAFLTDRAPVFYGPATRQAGLTTYQLALESLGVRTASAKDQRLADTLLALREKPHRQLLSVGETSAGRYYVADKEFEGRERQPHWQQAYGVALLHAPRRDSLHPWPQASRRWLASLRQIAETVFAKLTHTFRLNRERPHTLRGFSARLAAKVARHNFCHWLNRSLNRPALAFVDLLGW